MKHPRSVIIGLLLIVLFAAFTYFKLYPAKLSQDHTTGTNSSATNPASISVIVNKTHPLNPLTYTPAQLVVPNIPLRSNITDNEKQVSSVMAPALEAMVSAAKQQGVLINLRSGYRSYALQQKLYNYYVQTQGQAQADMYSAKPGYSEHQTGLAVDLGDVNVPSCNVQDCFADTAAGKWLDTNAYKYGFILRYPNGKQGATGYAYEPWHYRYVGTVLATKMYKQHIPTLEQAVVY